MGLSQYSFPTQKAGTQVSSGMKMTSKFQPPFLEHCVKYFGEKQKQNCPHGFIFSVGRNKAYRGMT